jgi:hypothetical protein
MSEGAPPRAGERKRAGLRKQTGPSHLPARFFAAAAAEVVATAAAATIAATAAKAAAAATAATPAAAEATFRLRTSFVHDERTPFQLMLVKLGDRPLGLLVGAHLHECESARPAGGHVPHDPDGIDLPGTAEQFSELVLGGRIR